MKKIEKTCELSSAYKTWVQTLDDTGQDHDEYNSSKNTFYLDVVMNLFHCQKGLCAYTEMKLCPDQHFDKQKWQDGKYALPKPEYNGQLEHFDPDKKTGKGWCWENFFMADTDVNTKVKRKKDVDVILKPDHAVYDQDKLLFYNSEMHLFIPHPDLDKELQDRVRKMIGVLGINFGPIAERRRRYLSLLNTLIKLDPAQYKNIEPEEFPTAFRMMQNQNTNI